ncbi:redox-sensing transcriptional repressor Rex [bacterium]|nr:redox-sensing transcriptional repressor Rex [bacterium]
MSTRKDEPGSPPPLTDELSRSSVERLYSYYLMLQHALDRGKEHISSRELASYLSIGDTQVRKDMAAIGVSGQPKHGYRVEDAIQALRRAMGLDRTHATVVCGVGKLGRALLEYSRFAEFGFNVVGAFDIRRELVGRSIGGVQVLAIDRLPQVLEIFGVEIGVITVNVWAAQEIADKMVSGGVRSIWNFAPLHLNVPENVLVRNEDFAASLTVISRFLSSPRR